MDLDDRHKPGFKMRYKVTKAHDFPSQLCPGELTVWIHKSSSTTICPPHMVPNPTEADRAYGMVQERSRKVKKACNRNAKADRPQRICLPRFQPWPFGVEKHLAFRHKLLAGC